jgi:hypothetical protein
MFTADCSFLVELATVSPVAMTAVSSAYVAMVIWLCQFIFLQFSSIIFRDGMKLEPYL